MNIIWRVDPPHDCQGAISALQQGETLWIGSIVECDCGQMYILTDHQMEGRYWAKYSSEPRNF